MRSSAARGRLAPPLQALSRACDRAALLAHGAGPARLVAVSVRLDRAADPLGWLAAADDRTRVYWQDGDHWIAGLGAAATVRTAGAQRFARASAAVTRLAAAAELDGPEAARPLFIGGFSFDDRPGVDWRGFPSLRLVAPRTTIERRGDDALLTVTVRAGGGADVGAQILAARRDVAALPRATLRETVMPTLSVRSLPGDDEWLALVARASADVRAGRLTKVVLARAVLARAASPLDPVGVVARLRHAHPGARVFLVGGAGASFVGATPEWLARVRGRDVRTAALAGSLAAGRPGGALLASAKDRSEHAIVVDAIVERLAPISDRVVAGSEPVVGSIGYIQHLRTPIAARLRERLGVVVVAGLLHPTPAIAGAPRDAALRIIRARERTDRGWYGGGVGWMDASGDGEFAVAIRSALLRGRTARIFAGAGIVAASDPRSELAETETKMLPLLRALGAATA